MPVTALTQADLLALVDRLLPESFIGPLKRVGPGYELLQAAAAACARVSRAVAEFDRDAFVMDADAGGYATAQVRFARPTAGAGALTIKAGTVVAAGATGRFFVLQEDVALTSGGAHDLLSVPATVKAVAKTYEYNDCLAPRTTAGGETIPGDIDAITTLVTSPDFADPTITVAQYADASGGAMDDLDQLGADLGLPRLPGEGDAAYRSRIRQLPDVVSPAAIRRVVTSFFQQFAPAGASWAQTYVLETWQLDFCTAFDVPNADTLPSSSPLKALTLNTCFFYDDTRGPGDTNVPNASGYYGRWMGLNDYRGAFIVVVPLLPAIADRGMFYDDPSPTPVGGAGTPVAPLYQTDLGSRGASFYDAGALTAAPTGFYDGRDAARDAVYAGLFAVLDKVKAGGVCAEVVLFGLS